MYDKFGGSFRIINERATKEPQYRDAALAGMYGPAQPMHMSTLLGMTQMVTPSSQINPNDSVFANVYNIWQNTTY